jgi:putative membrane protein
MPESRDENQEAGGFKSAFNKASDMVGGAVGLSSVKTSGAHSAEAFVANACVGDLYEIQAGMVAAQRATSNSVRAFGEMMVEHHTTAMHQMQAALGSSEVTRDFPDLSPTDELDERRRGMMKHLVEAADDDFDKTYLDQQKVAHREAVVLHKGYAENGDNPQLRSVALGGLPMVERHLKALERIGAH